MKVAISLEFNDEELLRRMPTIATVLLRMAQGMTEAFRSEDDPPSHRWPPRDTTTPPDPAA